MATIDIRALDDRGTKFRLQAEPVLRFTNPVGGSKDGALFLWLAKGTGQPSRPDSVEPAADLGAGILFAIHESRSIAKSADGRVWGPSKGGVSFKPVPDAPKPAETAERRLRQMRDGRRFLGRALLQREDLEQASLAHQAARPISASQARTSRTAACSVLSTGTDPEVLLMLESRPGKDGPEWQYAFAPMTGFAVNTFWKGKAIWSKPAEANGSARNPSNTFHIRRVLVEADR